MKAPHPTHYICREGKVDILYINLSSACFHADQVWELYGIKVEIIPPQGEGVPHGNN